MPALDGLRGIAVIAVFGIHMGILRGGRIGVDIFFALSGYLITSILLSEYERTGAVNLRNFYLRRAIRLLPALLVFLFVVAVWAQFADLFVIPAGRALSSALLYFANLQITWLLPTNEHLGPLTHTWSLSIEEQFYLAWPLLLVIGLKRSIDRGTLFLLTCGAALSIIAWRLWLFWHGALADRLYFGGDTHSDGLMIGCAFALMPESIKSRLQNAVTPLWPMVVLVLVWLIVTPFTRTLKSWLGISMAAACTATLIWSIPASKTLRTFLSQPVLVWIGLRSYSLYLWHFAVVWGEFFDGLGLPSWVVAVIETSVAVGLAEASYRWIERPALALKGSWVKSGNPVADTGGAYGKY